MSPLLLSKHTFHFQSTTLLANLFHRTATKPLTGASNINIPTISPWLDHEPLYQKKPASEKKRMKETHRKPQTSISSRLSTKKQKQESSL